MFRYFLLPILCLVSLNGQKTLIEQKLKNKLQKSGVTVKQAKDIAKKYNLLENDQSKLNQKIDKNSNDENIVKVKTEINKLNQQEMDKSINIEIDEAASKSLMNKDDKLTLDNNRIKINQNKLNNPGYHFGYEVFNSDPELFQQSSFGVVTPDYLIGPGDEIVIMLWGETELNSTYIVSRDGDLFIENLGKVIVNGLTLGQLEKKLFRLLKRVYSSLDSKTGDATTFFDVSLGSLTLRPTRIFVLGDLDKPGAYSVNPSTTLFTALYYFNGPTINGSLRNVQLLRNGKEISSIDVYDYLLTGKQNNDIRLQRNDVIFIPRRGKTVSVAGEIGRQAIYELNEDEGLKELIYIAGNVKTTTYMNRIQIDRIIAPEQRKKLGMDRTFIDIELGKALKQPENFQLFDGDKIQFFNISNEHHNIVSIEGSVIRPGTYDLGNGLKLSDLIKKADGLSGQAYLDRADIIRKNHDNTLTHLDINLGMAMDGDTNENINLKHSDKIVIYNYSEMLHSTDVVIIGHVSSPGAKPFKKGMEVFDLIFEGGGFENQKHLENTYFDRAELMTWDKDSLRNIMIPFRLDSVLSGSGIANRKLKMGDNIRIYSKEEIKGLPNNNVIISGHVKRPGNYSLSKDMKLLDLLFLGGGLDDKEHLSKTYLERADLIRISDDRETQRISSFKLSDAIDSVGSSNFFLSPGDIINIYSKEIFKKPKSVTINGSIRNPGSYTIKNNMSIKDLILEAGGVEANIPKFRIDISSMLSGKNNLDKYAQIVSFDLDNNAELFRITDNKGNQRENIMVNDYDIVTIRPDPFYVKQRSVKIEGLVYYPGEYVLISANELITDIINRAGGLRSEAYPEASILVRDGEKISIAFEKIIKRPNSKLNFKLIEGDEITIYGRPNLVKIEGAINSPGNFQFFPKTRLGEYIKLAGGLTPDASRQAIFIQYPNGLSKKISMFNFSPLVLDGSIITIGKKEEVEPFNFTEYATSITTIWADITQAYLMVVLAMRSTE